MFRDQQHIHRQWRLRWPDGRSSEPFEPGDLAGGERKDPTRPDHRQERASNVKLGSLPIHVHSQSRWSGLCRIPHLLQFQVRSQKVSQVRLNILSKIQ